MYGVGGDMTMARRWMAAAALAATSFAATNVEAASWQDRRKAQKLGREAKALAVKGDFDEAAKKYREADELIPAPSYKLELARMLVATEDFIEASKVLAVCVEKEPHQWVEKVAYKKCEKFIVEVDERTPTLTVTVFEPSAETVDIVVDGESYEAGEGAVRFNPGKVEVEAEAPGYEPFSKSVKLMEGDRETFEISMTKAAPTGDGEEEQDEGEGISPVWAYTTWAVSAVGLGVGIGFGVAAIQSTNDVLREYECDDNDVCPAAAQQDLNTAKLNGNISTAGFVVGFAGVTAGTILFLFSSAMDDDESDAVDEEEAALGIEARPMLGPGFVGVTGTF